MISFTPMAQFEIKNVSAEAVKSALFLCALTKAFLYFLLGSMLYNLILVSFKTQKTINGVLQLRLIQSSKAGHIMSYLRCLEAFI